MMKKSLLGVIAGLFFLCGCRATPLALVGPTDGETVPLLRDGVKRYQAMPRKERVAYFASVPGRKEMKRIGDKPLPVTLRWRWTGATNALFAVLLATDPAFSNRVPVSAADGTFASAGNLEIARRYYWKVSAMVGGRAAESASSSFLTEDRAPRLLAFDNVPNVRDLGGRKTLQGRRVRQGLVYRTAGLNNNAQTDTNAPAGFIPGRNRLTPSGRRYIVGTLGVRSDIDLRSDGECRGMTGSPLGPEVTWFHYSSSAYDGMQNAFGRQAFTKVFRVFLDRKNYPIVFHCIAGQDRTGSVAFILNGLLGVPEEELYLDWEYSGLYNSDSKGFNHRNRFDKLVRGFDRFAGATLNERIAAYVLSLGFTPADIAAFRAILLED